jgi:hypothetical protein
MQECVYFVGRKCPGAESDGVFHSCADAIVGPSRRSSFCRRVICASFVLRWMSGLHPLLLGQLLLLGGAALQAQAVPPDAPEANPARPTVSTPATLTPVGYLQFENGGLYATDSPEFSTRLGINEVTKLTLDSRVELLTLLNLSRIVPAQKSQAIGRAKFSRECKG